METLAAIIRGAHFEPSKRGGYDRDSVDEFLTDLATRVAAVEDSARQETLRANALQRRFAVAGDATDSIETAYMAAAEAKQKLLGEAEQKAAEIVRAAELEASALVSAPRKDAERTRKEAEDILLQAKARLDAADTEARQRAKAAAQRVEAAKTEAGEVVAAARREGDRLLEAAKEEAAGVVAGARREAMSIIAASQREATELVAATVEEHDAIVNALHTLKAAVADMLGRGAAGSEAIRVVIDEAPAAVRNGEQAVV